MIVHLIYEGGKKRSRYFHCQDIRITTKDGKVQVEVYDTTGLMQSMYTAERAAIYGDSGRKIDEYAGIEYGQ